MRVPAGVWFERDAKSSREGCVGHDEPRRAGQRFLGHVLGVLKVPCEHIRLTDQAGLGLVEEASELLPLERHPGLLRRSVPHQVTRLRTPFRIEELFRIGVGSLAWSRQCVLYRRGHRDHSDRRPR